MTTALSIPYEALLSIELIFSERIFGTLLCATNGNASDHSTRLIFSSYSSQCHVCRGQKRRCAAFNGQTQQTVYTAVNGIKWPYNTIQRDKKCEHKAQSVL